MAAPLKPDLCIIGRGATGINLALRARQRGAEVVLIDRGVPEPGDPAHGLIARAALLASAARAHAIRTAATVGIETASPRPSFRSVGEHATAIAAETAPEHSRERLAALGIVNLTGSPEFVDRRTVTVGETSVTARHTVLATGARPVLPAIPGLDAVPFFTADSVLAAVRKFSHLLVVGGEPAAVELAQAYRRLGAEVSLVPQGPLLPGFDPELVALLAVRLAAEGIDIHLDASVTEIIPRSQGTGVQLLGPDGAPFSLDVSHILIAAGRMPDLAGDWLAKAGLKHDARSGRLLLGPDGRTGNPHLTVLGGAAADLHPAEVARRTERLLDRLLGGKANDVPAIRHVATDPALAEVGHLPASERSGPAYVIHRANLAENGAARAFGAAEGGAKLVVSGRGAILGGGAVGTGAGETVAMLAQAMGQGTAAVGLSRLSLPEPSPAAVLVALGREAEAAAPRRPAGVLRRLLG